MAPRFKYKEEAMLKAVEAVGNGMPKRTAAKKFYVPCSTLADKVAGRTQLGRRMGKVPYLTAKEEEELVK